MFFINCLSLKDNECFVETVWLNLSSQFIYKSTEGIGVIKLYLTGL